MPRKSPTVRQKRLGMELRRLRERAHVSLDDAAAVLECNKAKISRIETGLSGVRPYELRGLLKVYGVGDGHLADALVEMAKEGNKRGWWNRYEDVLPGISDLAHLEAKAISLHVWQTLLVPGLLQTRDYMRTLFKGGRFADSGPEFEKSIESRLARQAVLAEGGAPEYWVVLYESVLHARVGGNQIMRGQLEHLIELVESDRIMVQLMPFGPGVHGGLDGPFTIYAMPVPGMDVVKADSVASQVYLENDGDIARFRALFDVLRAAALGPVPSLGLLKQEVRRLR